ncbi:hypothetical protein Nepgr_029647 [Nepenthes gracilis]|uniref:Uncharacterized protein n=1 Tax=Nepenthes gracilis TaxID=150966 RepID=A0AAD3TEP5_NEPGR|nr:hypothetical protein Nepgr_029647 [Nepenthes gracilis]
MDVCEKFWSAISSSHAFRTHNIPISQQSEGIQSCGGGAVEDARHSTVVPIIIDTTAASDDKEKAGEAAKVGTEAEQLVIRLRVLGQETKEAAAAPTADGCGKEGNRSEYVDRKGSKIRAATSTVGGDMSSSMRRDSFNDKVSEYIKRTKFRFGMPSYVEARQEGQRRLK